MIFCTFYNFMNKKLNGKLKILRVKNTGEINGRCFFKLLTRSCHMKKSNNFLL